MTSLETNKTQSYKREVVMSCYHNGDVFLLSSKQYSTRLNDEMHISLLQTIENLGKHKHEIQKHVSRNTIHMFVPLTPGAISVIQIK